MYRRTLLVILFLSFHLESVLSKPSDFDLVAEESKQYELDAGKSHIAIQQLEQGETGKKGYYAKHANEKGERGHHDKEQHQKEYAEEGGTKNAHNHDDGYYTNKHNKQHGEQGYHYVDKGSYAKGHDTKGHHNIHKLDEFKKKKEFLDEIQDQAHKEKHGGFDLTDAFKNGDFKYGGRSKKVVFEGEFGATGKSEKGGHNLKEDGHRIAGGHDEYFKDAEEFAKNGSDEFFKIFGFNEKDLH